MVAHLDSVTSLAVDQHGLYLISGSHDCSIRWPQHQHTGLHNQHRHCTWCTPKHQHQLSSVHQHQLSPAPQSTSISSPLHTDPCTPRHTFLRLWNLESKTCVQEITAHRSLNPSILHHHYTIYTIPTTGPTTTTNTVTYRKKFDESIFDVAFHPSRPYIASAGDPSSSSPPHFLITSPPLLTPSPHPKLSLIISDNHPSPQELTP